MWFCCGFMVVLAFLKQSILLMEDIQRTTWDVNNGIKYLSTGACCFPSTGVLLQCSLLFETIVVDVQPFGPFSWQSLRILKLYNSCSQLALLKMRLLYQFLGLQMCFISVLINSSVLGSFLWGGHKFVDVFFRRNDPTRRSVVSPSHTGPCIFPWSIQLIMFVMIWNTWLIFGVRKFESLRESSCSLKQCHSWILVAIYPYIPTTKMPYIPCVIPLKSPKNSGIHRSQVFPGRQHPWWLPMWKNCRTLPGGMDSSCQDEGKNPLRINGLLETTTLPETNSSPQKMVVSNRNFLFQWSIFRGYVSFREGNGLLETTIQ